MQRRRERTKRMMIDSSEITTRERKERKRERILDSPFSALLLESYASLLLHSSSSGLPGIGSRETLCKSSPSIHQPAALASFANLVVGGLPSISLPLSLSPPPFPLSSSRLVGRFTFAFYAFTNFSLAEMTHFASSRWKMQPTSLAGPSTLSPPFFSLFPFISPYPPSLFNQYRGPVSPDLYPLLLLLIPSSFPPLLVSYYFFSYFLPSYFPFRSVSSFFFLSLSIFHSSPSPSPASRARQLLWTRGLFVWTRKREQERSGVSLCSLARRDKISFVDEQSPDE